MSGFFFYKPRSIVGETLAQGEATDAALWSAARERARLADNVNSAAIAQERVYDDWIGRIKAATGQELDNPVRKAQQEDANALVGMPARVQASPFVLYNREQARGATFTREKQAFMDRVFSLAEQSPEGLGSDWALFDPEARAAALVRQSDERLGTLMASRKDWGAAVINFGGQVSGSLHDPFQVATLLVGGGASAARTAIGRILAIGTREALINAGAETIVQPAVQAWREKAGLPAGFDEALKNVAFAGAAGAVLGSAAAGLGEGARALGGRTRAAGTPSPRAGTDAALGSFVEAARGQRALRDALPPEARGALDAGENLDRETEALNALDDPAQYDALRAPAARAAEGDLDALGQVAGQPPKLEPPEAAPSASGLDDPFDTAQVDALTDRMGAEFDEEQLMQAVVDPETGDMLPLGDVLERAKRSDGLSRLVRVCGL